MHFVGITSIPNESSQGGFWTEKKLEWGALIVGIAALLLLAISWRNLNGYEKLIIALYLLSHILNYLVSLVKNIGQSYLFQI